MQDYILGQVLHRSNRFGTSYSTTGRHYITIKGEMIAQSIHHATVSPILKIKGKVTFTSNVCFSGRNKNTRGSKH